MRQSFVAHVLELLVEDGILATADDILAVCAGPADVELFACLGFRNVAFTSAGTPGARPDGARSGEILLQDTTNLRFADGAFDFSFVSDGLHHCDSPHKALLEMYRVARRGVIVFESRDSLTMRLAVALGLTKEYEVVAVTANGGRCGGVNNTDIPNYVYRWTEREFEKTIRAYDPTGEHRFRYFYGLNLPWQAGGGISRPLLRGVSAIASALTLVFRKQRNSFTMIALKRGESDVWPWLELREGRVRFRQSLAAAKPVDGAQAPGEETTAPTPR